MTKIDDILGSCTRDELLAMTDYLGAPLRESAPKKVIGTVIPRGVRLSEAPSYGMPIMYYDKNSKGSQAYLNLAEELMRKENKNG